MKTTRIGACDLGKATARFAVASISEAAGLSIDSSRVIHHHGKPFELFADWYEAEQGSTLAALAATGLYASDLLEPIVRIPEEACLEAALRGKPELSGPLNLVSIGARGYSALSRGADGAVQQLSNDKCSSGTGETMAKMAARFGFSISEVDELALAAADQIPITARCSVFAKSEMTHFANQGKPADQLFRGYFDSIARYVAALLGRIRVEGPVLAIGGAAQIRSLLRGLTRYLGVPIALADDAALFETVGALVALRDALATGELHPGSLPSDPQALVRRESKRFETLAAPRELAERVRRLPARPLASSGDPAILGIDLGSTGSKAVLTSITTGEPIWDAYDRTRGNPVDAARRLVTKLLVELTPDVRAIGLTGSGREAVATVVRACFPEREVAIIVQNEIVAHATAAIHCDADGGKSLSVVEIGGQDAKFIQIVGGAIVESDLNKACSAGTGSFLEEQALLYGVDDVVAFTEEAMRASAPPNLGQMCTVFVADAAASAHAEGFAREDIFGGFQYSVIHNYVNRVKGNRTFGERIFFQGKPASGPSLAWTLAAVTGREVVVPPNPGAMGAWGIGLCTVKERGREALDEYPGLALTAFLEAEVVERSEIRCLDKKCGTLCHIDRTTVRVGEVTKAVFSGGACPKFEQAGVGRDKLPTDAPRPIERQRAIFERYFESGSARRARDGERGSAAPADRPSPETQQAGRVIGVPLGCASYGFLPWISTFLSHLGFSVRVLRSSGESLARGEERCLSYDACAPLKIVHSLCDGEANLLFFPKVLGYRDANGPGGVSCPVELAAPEIIEGTIGARRPLEVLRPRLDFSSGLDGLALVRELARIAPALGVPPEAVVDAVHAAAREQQRVWDELRALGEEVLAWAKPRRIPVVVVCGPLHVINDDAVNVGIPQILQRNGVIPLPMDAFPLGPSTPPFSAVVWGDANRAIRVAHATRELGFVFPLLLSTFGCGPASFVEHLFGAVMAGYPHTMLESDGHGGAAGYVTRIQAFLHTVRAHGQRPAPCPPAVARQLERVDDPPVSGEKDSRLVMFALSDRFSPLFAAFYRSFGYDAVAAGPPDARALTLGRRDCSGKECLPYHLIWGSFRRHLEESPPAKRTVLCQVQGEGMCRNCMFSVKDRLTLASAGLDQRVAVRHVRPEPEFGLRFVTKFWASGIAWDLNYQCRAYYRPMLRDGRLADALYQRHCDELEALVERPDRLGLRGIPYQVRYFRELGALVERQMLEWASLPRRHGTRQLRTVLLTGDVYLRLDPFGSDDLATRLGERGLRPIVEPMSILGDYLAHERSPELIGLPTGWLENRIARTSMGWVRSWLYGIARVYHRWLPLPDAGPAIERSRPLLDRYPMGEAPIAIGSALHCWEQGACDGLVLIGPWGCGPALVTENILRRHREIPMLFVYTDGSPIDGRKLDGFAFRLRQRPARTTRSAAHV